MITLSEASTTVRAAAALARLVPWAKLVPNLAAKWFGVMTFNPVDPETKDFKDTAGNVVYSMTQVWISNGTRVDYRGVRCKVVWRRVGGGAFEGLELDALWCRKLASGLASYPEGVEETTDLLSNGETKHLGLLVQSSATKKVYAVGTATYYAGTQYPNYEHPKFEILPGVWDVTIHSFGSGGYLGSTRLQTQFSGGSAQPITIPA